MLSIFLIVAMLSPISYAMDSGNKLKKEEIVYSNVRFEGICLWIFVVRGFSKGF